MPKLSKKRRPRKGTTYAFVAAGLDRFDRKAFHPPDGTLVRLTQPSLTPVNGTMGYYYVEDAETGQFYGLVSGASLLTLAEYAGATD